MSRLLLGRCKRERLWKHLSAEVLTLAAQVRDCNDAFFDAANQFAGTISSMHKVLRQNGLLEKAYCLDADEVLSLGHVEEIGIVYRAYPHLHDDDFVKENIDCWMKA